MRKKLTLLAVVAALGVFSLASVAVASAHGWGWRGSDGEPSPIWDRVAEILGVDAADLQSAVAQARSEAHQERMAERLAQAVEDEIITQEEADAIQAWFDGWPEALSSLSHREQHELHRAVRAGELGDFLAGLVEEELITQAEADEIAGWINSRPAALDELIPTPPFGPHGGFGARGGFGPRHGFGGFGPRGFFHDFHALPESDSESSDTAATGVGVGIRY